MASNETELSAVRFVLDKEWPDGTTSNDVAKAVVKALDDVRATTWRPIGPPLKVGTAFKSIISAKTHYVLWIGDDGTGVEYAWIMTADSEYGWFGATSSPFWRWTSPVAEAKGTTRRIKQFDSDGEPLLDENGKQVIEVKYYPPVTDKLFANSSYSVGDVVKMRQGAVYEILAVHQNGVLFRDIETQAVWPESNHSLDKYYKKIKREVDW